MTNTNETRASTRTGLDRALAVRKAGYRLAEPLEERKYKIERVAKNMSKTLALSDLQTRLVNFYSPENNHHHGKIMAPKAPVDYDGKAVFSCPEFYLDEALSFFAEREDPLCRAIRDYMKSFDPSKYVKQGTWHGGSRVYLCLDDNSDDIGAIRRLAYRKMTEREYSGILNGEMPFAKDIKDVLHYLPKPTRETK
jgi:hypothetical protein